MGNLEVENELPVWTSHYTDHYSSPVVIWIRTVIWIFESSSVRFKMDFHTCQRTINCHLHELKQPHTKGEARNATVQLIHITLLHVQTDD